MLFDDDEGVGDGVTREAFSLFWEAVVGVFFVSQGGDIPLPVLSPTQNPEMWEIIGRILAFTLAVLGQFPSNCITEVICQAIFNLNPAISHRLLVNTFLNSLRGQDRALLRPLFDLSDLEDIRSYIEERRQDILDLLRELNVQSVPAPAEARSLMVNLSRHQVLESPRGAIDAIRTGFLSVTGRHFSGVTVAMISSWYQQQRSPIFDDLFPRLLLEDSTEEGGERVFGVLLDFLRQHRSNEDLLRRFLRHCTGSTNARGDAIRVSVSARHHITLGGHDHIW